MGSKGLGCYPARIDMRLHGLSALLLLSLWPSQAMAADGCGEGGSDAVRGAWDLRWDNDAFGSASQDRGYSNGMVIAAVSADVADPAQPSCPRWPAIGSRPRAATGGPGQDVSLHRLIALRHDIYTPADKTRTDLIEDDRPYVGALLLSLGTYRREGERLRVDQWRFGMVGPSARGEQVQNAVHRVIGVRLPQGWQHQLRDEPVLQWVHERLRRWHGGTHGDALGWDAIGHAGASLGNFATHANAGVEWRWGWRLPDDFGSSSQRPGQPYGAVAPTAGRRDWRWHLFVGVEGRWVLRDITLDGNTFKSSHRVDKRPFVADLGYGLVVAHGHWRYTLAQYQRSREFDGQAERPSFGSISVSRAF